MACNDGPRNMSSNIISLQDPFMGKVKVLSFLVQAPDRQR